MGTPQKRITLSLETTYELIMAIEKKEMRVKQFDQGIIMRLKFVFLNGSPTHDPQT